MRCNPLRWLWGLLPLAALTGITLLAERPIIERDLQTRTRAALEAASLNWATPSFEARDGTVGGIADEESERIEALAIARGVWGVRVADSNADVVAEQRPFTWSASRDSNRIKIRGFVPSKADRKKILGIAAASFPGFEIDDGMAVARGVPDDRQAWLGGISFGLSQLAKLKEGQFRLEDLGLSLRGLAGSTGDYRAVMSNLGSLPAGVTLQSASITPPIVKPFVWMAQLQGKQVSLSGFVPGEDARADQIKTAKRVLKGVTVSDKMELATGSPEGWMEASGTALEQLLALSNGSARITDLDVDITGLAADEATAAAIRSKLKKGLPKRYKLSDRIEVARPKLPTIKPFTWSADFDGSSLTLGGWVHSEDERKAVLAHVSRRFPPVKIVDRMKLGLGGPAERSWGKGLGFLIDQLALLRKGRAWAGDYQLNISGEPADLGLHKAVTAALASPPAEFGIGVADISMPVIDPFVWEARYDGSALELDGYVPSEGARAGILAHVGRRFPGYPVADRMQLAGGAPGDEAAWVKACATGIRALAVLQKGEARLTARELAVVGSTLERTLPGRMDGLIAGTLPSGFKARSDIAYVGITEEDEAAAAKKKADEEAEAARKAAEEEEAAARRKAEEEAALAEAAEKEAARQARWREEEKKRLAMQAARIEAARKRAEEEAALAEAKRHAEEEAARIAAAEAEAAEAERVAKLKDEYNWTARYDGLTIEFTGLVPSHSARFELFDYVKNLFPDRTIKDSTSVVEGAPFGWMEAAKSGLSRLAELESGEVDLRKDRLKLTGSTDSKRVLASARKTVKSELPSGYAGEEAVVYVAPPEPDPALVKRKESRKKYNFAKLLKSDRTLTPLECDAVLNGVLGKGKAFFASGKYELGPDSEKTLKTLVTVAKRCPESRINIVGHTDSDGAATYNQRLSEQRAKAVVAYLTKSGIDADRLSATGMGEMQPVASNDTSEHKRRNRRIEFEVQIP